MYICTYMHIIVYTCIRAFPYQPSCSSSIVYVSPITCLSFLPTGFPYFLRKTHAANAIKPHAQVAIRAQSNAIVTSIQGKLEDNGAVTVCPYPTVVGNTAASVAILTTVIVVVIAAFAYVVVAVIVVVTMSCLTTVVVDSFNERIMVSVEVKLLVTTLPGTLVVDIIVLVTVL